MSVYCESICQICPSGGKGMSMTTITLHLHTCPCEVRCWHVGLLCRMSTLPLYMPLPVGLDGWMAGVEWESEVLTGLTGCFLCLFQVGVHLRERLPVHRHSSELRLQQNERSGLYQCEWIRESLGCGRLRLPSAGR